MRSTTLGYGSRKNRKLLSGALSVLNDSNATLFNFASPRFVFSDDGVTPVVANDPIRRANNLGGAVSVFEQATLGARPLFTTELGASFDGTDDILEGTETLLNVAQNANVVTFAARFKTGALAATQHLVSLSSNGAGNRFALRVLATGAFQYALRRLDADTPLGYSTSAGTVAANTSYSVIAVVDYAGNFASIYLNDGPDLLAAALTLASAPGPTSNTTSLRARLGASPASTPTEYFNGSLRKVGFTNKLLTAAERATVFAYLNSDLV